MSEPKKRGLPLDGWTCSGCGIDNLSDAVECIGCYTVRKFLQLPTVAAKKIRSPLEDAPSRTFLGVSGAFDSGMFVSL